MLALFLAMITLSNSDPDAVKPQPVSLVKQGGAGGLALDGPLAGFSPSDDSTVSVCTYGTPPLGAQLWNDASALTRTFTQPQCSSSTDGFGAPFTVQDFTGNLGGFQTLMPWVMPRIVGPVGLQTSPARRVLSSLPSFGLSAGPQRLEGITFRGPSEPGSFGGLGSTHAATRESAPARSAVPERRN